MIPGYKPFISDPPANVANLLTKARGKTANISNISNISKAPQNNYDAETVLERAAIMEYDGDLPRGTANTRAAQDADAHRPREYGDTRQYQHYIEVWQPSTPGDLPCPPPNCTGNGLLWLSFWQRIEGIS